MVCAENASDKDDGDDGDDDPYSQQHIRCQQ